VAKKKTTPKTKKKTAASSTPKKSAKKSPAKKTVKKKKVTEKKTSSKKKVVKKKTTGKIAKKTTKTVKKAATKPTTKKTTKKSVKKKSSTKKTTIKKTAAKKTGSKKTPSKSSGKKAGSKAKKTSPKSSKTGTNKIPRGRSVAEIASMTQADSDGYVIISGRRVRMMATKPSAEIDSGGKGSKKKTRKSVSKNDLSTDGVISEQKPGGSDGRKKIKTSLTKRELNHYRDLLLQKRRDMFGDLKSHENQALRANDGDVSTMPIHMADIGSDTYEQEFMLGMAEKERERLKEIDTALALIAEKTYGVCQKTGEMIPKARLEAKPWARFTVEAARQHEVGE